MRLDLSVNILTTHALVNDKITVFGGDQLRPNLHIQSMCDLYQLLLEVPAEKIAGETFNAGQQNLSISRIAEIVRATVLEEFPEKGDIDIVTTPSDDLRSYHINSNKIKDAIGFESKRTIEDAVRDICQAYRQGKLPNALEDDKYYNVRTMKTLNAT